MHTHTNRFLYLPIQQAEAMLSSRGKVSADQLDIPWKFALGTTYDPDTNPEGLISFATAENVPNRVWTP